MPETWQRRRSEKESAQAYAAARVYFDLGEKRSLAAVGQKCSKSVSLIMRWSARWDWVERAADFDVRNDEAERKALEKAAAENALAWQERDNAERERIFAVSQTLCARVEKMCEFPLAAITTETTEEGGLTIKKTIIKPVRWTMDTAGRLAMFSHRLARMAILNEGAIDEANADLRDEVFTQRDFKLLQPKRNH